MTETIMKTMNFFNQDKSSSRFYLLNKNLVLAEFSVLGEGALEHIRIDKVFNNVPSWITDLSDFILHRKAPNNRENMKELLKMSGCDTILGWLNITHALSLIDSYWVKPIHSSLNWQDVSLYTHKFNEVIAKTAFEGGLHGYDLSSVSPEYGTDGTFAKCWIREEGVIKLVKRGSSGARNAGLEPFSELYSSQISKALDLYAVQYDITKYNNRICSVCEAFTSEDVGYLPFSALNRDRALNLTNVLKTYTQFGLEEEARMMFIFDAVIFNEDRHTGNFGFLINNNTNDVLGIAPYFDHNLSMLCYAEIDDLLRIEDYLKLKSPRIGKDFVEDARQLLTPKFKRKLKNIEGFKFIRSSKYNLPEERLELLEKIVNRQIRLIIS